MSSGRQDWSQLTVISGRYGSSYLPVLLDSAGQLFAIFKGTNGIDYIPIMLDEDGNLIARIKGSTGAALVDVKVDTAGQMYVRIMGLDGATQRQLAVDATGNIISRMQGSDSGTLRDVAVDGSGFLTALIKGLYGSTLKTCAVDVDGILKANLSAQSLDYLKMRPIYGAVTVATVDAYECANNTWTEIFSASGKGALVGGWIYFEAGISATVKNVKLTIDAGDVFNEAWETILGIGWFPNPDFIFYVLNWDSVGLNHAIGIGRGLSFEVSIKISVLQNSGAAKDVYGKIYYALVP